MLTGSRVNADTEYQEADDCQHLDHGEVELNFSVEIDGQEVECCDDDPEDTDEDANVQLWRPVLDDEAARGKFEGECDGPRELRGYD